MQDNVIFYDSKNYKYQTKIKVKTMTMSKTSRANKGIVQEMVIEPTRLITYDFNEYIQVDMIFDLENAYSTNQCHILEASLDVTKIAEKHQDKWVWSSIDVIPNGSYEKNRLELYTVNNVIKSISGTMVCLSCCCGIKEVNIILGNDIASGFTYKSLSNLVEYEVLTEEEKQFIKEDSTVINAMNYEHPKGEKATKFFNNLFGTNKKEDEGTLSAKALINSMHLTEQEKKIFDPEMLTVSAGMPNSEQALANLIGLENVKEEVKKLKSKLKYRKRQKERGILVEDASSMHMCFTGSPGTGKTTVARIITGILYDMGYIKENRCIEVNGQNLKGGYQGQTAIITKLVMKSAKNKVLFIDEAYALFDNYQGGYGKEAVAVILKHMEDERDNTVVIFAGYKNDMEEFLRMNDGLKSRINRYIDFKNYSTEELSKILISSLKKKKLYISELALGKCVLAFKKAASTERFSNARFVRNMLEKIEYEHAYNTHSTKDIRRQDTIEVEDVSDEVINELLTHSM